MTEPLRIYVAASSREMPRVDRALAFIDALGKDRAVVTYRWIDDMRATIASGRTEGDLTREESIEAAKKCLEGVYTSHVTWLLYPNTPTCGFWCELGACVTLAQARPSASPRMIASYDGSMLGSTIDRPTVPKIWRHLADHSFVTDAAAMQWIRERCV